MKHPTTPIILIMCLIVPLIIEACGHRNIPMAEIRDGCSSCNTCSKQQWESGQTIITIENGTLWVREIGAMEDYRSSALHYESDDWAPWYGYSCSKGGNRPKHCYLPITSIIIEDGVTHIGNFAFSGLKRLKSVKISASVVSIGGGAFHYCDSLASITVAEDNAHYASKDGILFNKDKTTLIRHPQGRSGAYTVPNSITTIGADAFYGCSGLTSVTIPNSVTIIESNLIPMALMTYSRKPNLVILKDDLISGTFANCIGLLSITIPGSVTSIGDWAFGGCTGLMSITIEDGVESIGSWAFGGCTGLASITIPGSVTSIEERAFHNCSSLTSVIIPGSVKAIGSGMFYHCTNLTSVTCLNPVPPDMKCKEFPCVNWCFNDWVDFEREVFCGLPPSACLYVPASSIDAYRASWWTRFRFRCIKDLKSAPKGEKSP